MQSADSHKQIKRPNKRITSMGSPSELVDHNSRKYLKPKGRAQISMINIKSVARSRESTDSGRVWHLEGDEGDLVKNHSSTLASGSGRFAPRRPGNRCLPSASSSSPPWRRALGASGAPPRRTVCCPFCQLAWVKSSPGRCGVHPAQCGPRAAGRDHHFRGRRLRNHREGSAGACWHKGSHVVVVAHRCGL